MSKWNTCLSVVRPAFLGVALLLTLVAMITPAVAGCTPGEKRIIVVDTTCCPYPFAMVTKQNQVCDHSGLWQSYGSPYCAFHSTCES